MNANLHSRHEKALFVTLGIFVLFVMITAAMVNSGHYVSALGAGIVVVALAALAIRVNGLMQRDARFQARIAQERAKRPETTRGFEAKLTRHLCRMLGCRPPCSGTRRYTSARG